ncbi:hypothetical protein FYK55_04765 [Roseiconus nitratireducens]|uniref:Uncharacterized protein n=1 Tax=Roseiconus nitratireducens TaxID=2605748 RepID=A0A5M6DLH3_9BACT|nr:hypothetical protein [Roseiconus nitratireducens]KAA5546205.1 hypothetical protein FYK55_04765 [Roseiconus nitratireducens]
MFQHFRSWVDVAPWIRLFPTLRILAAPVHVAIVLVAWAATVLTTAQLLQPVPTDLAGGSVSLPTTFQQARSVRGRGVSPLLAENRLTPQQPEDDVVMTALAKPDELFAGLPPIFATLRQQRVLPLAIFLSSMLLIWVPVVLTISRSGAVLAAGRPLPEMGTTLRWVRRRLAKSLLLPLVPWVCVLAFSIAVFVLRLPSLWVAAPWLSVVTGAIATVLLLPAGILAFGALFATPLGLAAMINEPDPDPIDSLSRGYEYLVRRPLSLVWYWIVSAALIYVASRLLGGVVTATMILASMVGTLFSPDATFIMTTRTLVEAIHVAWLITLGIALLGASYLLLRRDAGGQEVEDLWFPPAEVDEPLPELPEQAYKS